MILVLDRYDVHGFRMVSGKDGQGYSSDRSYAGQEPLQGRAARGLSMVGGWPRLPGGEGGVCFGFGSATRSR
jgi:hypothetical protein